MGCGSSNSLNDKNNDLTCLNKFKKKRPVRSSSKQISYKGITILENVQKYMPETISRDEIKDMVYDALQIKDQMNQSKTNLTAMQIDAIIDLLMKAISSDGNKNFNDKRLDDIKAIIGFYDVDTENVKKIFFKDQSPTNEEVEEKVNDIISMNDDAKLFAIEVQN